jgi:nucleoside 2-deoxyribosyltransferase
VSALSIVGGVYHERCTWPAWDQVYGSAGRAAHAISGHVDAVTLVTYQNRNSDLFKGLAELEGIVLKAEQPGPDISFRYVHSLSPPVIKPALATLEALPPLEVQAEIVLRFGMLEGTAVVHADRCVYDPQSAFNPEPFEKNGSRAKRLAIVGNRKEIVAMAGGGLDWEAAARALLTNGVEVVVVKGGVGGATVVQRSGAETVPAYQAGQIFTVGSGDVFCAVFAAEWACKGQEPVAAARKASRAVAEYVQSMSLPLPMALEPLPEAIAVEGLVYLAGPFFNIGQRWLVDEARRCLLELGLRVFSPIHDGGGGPAEQVGPADLEALDRCDLVFALLDGLDSGTLFEVGWAKGRQKPKPIYALAQSVSEEDLKMIVGSECRVFEDFVTALHHAAWRT